MHTSGYGRYDPVLPRCLEFFNDSYQLPFFDNCLTETETANGSGMAGREIAVRRLIASTELPSFDLHSLGINIFYFFCLIPTSTCLLRSP